MGRQQHRNHRDAQRRNSKRWSKAERRRLARIALERKISERTKKAYQSHLRQLRRSGCSLDFKGLERHILQSGEHGDLCLGSYKARIAAVQWHLARKGDREVISQKQMRVLLTYAEGMTAGLQRKERGAITETLLDELLRWMQHHGCSRSERNSIEVCWATALRTEQMKMLRRQHLTRDANDGSWTVTMPEHHTPTRRLRRNIKMVSKAVHQRAWAILDDITARLAPDALVFPDWNGKQANGWVQRASVDCHWDETKNWCGVHLVRHGRATEIFAAAPNRVGLRRVRHVLGHQQAADALQLGAAGHYIGRHIRARSPENRKKKSKIEKKKKTKKKERKHKH